MKHEKMKPAFSYYGGKQRMAAKILPLIPEHACYVEPFAGGAAVFFAKGRPDVKADDYREVLNDLDGRIVNFYKTLRDKPDELARACQTSPYSKEEHALCKDDSGDDIERARRWFVNIQQGFSNGANASLRRDKCTDDRASLRNSPIVFANASSRLTECAARLSQAYIEQNDAIACIKQWDSPHSFFYIDPPYPGSEQGHYSGYTQDDFARLVDCLGNIKGKFILSNYANDYPPKSWERFDVAAFSSAKRGSTKESGARTEVLWRKAA